MKRRLIVILVVFPWSIFLFGLAFVLKALGR